MQEDESYLNKRGLTHFWENIDALKQDKLTAGANITIASDNTISASQPTVNDATLTIQKEGTSVGTFTANASTNSTVNIIETDPTVPAWAKASSKPSYSWTEITNKPTIPTKTSDLTNDSGFLTSIPIASSNVLGGIMVGSGLAISSGGVLSATGGGTADDVAWGHITGTMADQTDLTTALAAKANSADLATVATSGDYDDLTDKPTIGNATLTIQKNGTSAGTFTANATSNKTINITVPTTAADVSALPASTKYGASVAVSVNTTDYKVTTTLKDQDGNTLGTAQVIDLPLESVVVNGSYDNANKKIVLTLQNGNTIDIPVADLVAGLQSEITSTNKLASDLVDDTNQTHKFVTSAQITKLNGIATGAEVNQNAFSNVKVGSTTVAADTKTDTLELVAGSNVTLTPDATDDTVTIAATDTTYSNATTSAAGLMSAADKTKLNGIATGAEANVQSDWSVTDTTSDAFIKNKPTLATVATSGSYNDLSNRPTIPTVNNATLTITQNGTSVGTFTANASSNKTIAVTDTTYDNATTSTAGLMSATDKTKLNGIATGAEVNVQSDWTQTTTTADDYIKNKPTLATVATSGSYNDLSNKPTIPTVNNATLTIQKNGANVQTFTANQGTNATANITVPTKTSDLTNDSGFLDSVAWSDVTGKPTFATVATSGSYNDLSNKPTIPAAQVQSDWAQTTATAVDYIKNKPSLATVATSGSYNDLSNKPTVGDATLTVKHNNVSQGTFTANATTNSTVDIKAPLRVDLSSTAQTNSFRRTVIGLCEVSTTNSTEKDSFSSGRIIMHRNNGLAGAVEINIQIENQYSNAYYTNVAWYANLKLLPASADIDTAKGFRPCTFKYDDVWYGGIEVFVDNAQLGHVVFEGDTNFAVFALDYYQVAHDQTASTILNQEVYDSLNYTQWTLNRGKEFFNNIDLYTGSMTKNDTYTYTFPNKNGTVAMTSDIPSVPTVNNATLTIQKNGANVQTFTANQGTNATANITVPTKTSELTNNSGYITSSSLSSYLPKSGGTMTGATYGYFPAVATTMVGNEYNILLNGGDRYTFTQSGTGTLTNAQVKALFDGELAPQYSSDGVNPNDPYVLLVEGLPNTHTQTGGVFGWTCRYYLPTTFKVELYDTYNSRGWVTIVEKTNTPTKELFVDLRAVTSGGAFTKIRITIYDSNGAVGANGHRRWGISEIFFCHPEAISAYEYASVDKANTATKATQDANGDVIDTTYAKKSEIPTVNNATLTIQRNGTNVQTFTANQSTNATANITVPTKTSDLTNDSGFLSSIPTASASALGGIKVGNNLTIGSDGTLSASASPITVDSALSSSSENPVQNKVINTALSGKQASLSTEQLDAANSSITAAKVASYDAYASQIAEKADLTALDDKQDTLTAGDHIDITNDVISAVDYVHSENPVSVTSPTPTVTGSMIANGTITADKLATGATIQLTLSTTDIGEGAALAANTLYGVYQ